MQKEQLEILLKDMSLREKIGQLVQIPGFMIGSGSVITGPALEMGFSEEDFYNAGATLSVFDFDQIKEIQDKFMEHQPHHIPLLFMGDIINGYRSVFPIPLAQGCSFDPELSGRLAAMSAKESAAAGLHVTFSPMVDVVRDARWGRVMESTGEDTYLNECFAKETVKGYQGSNLADAGSVAACVKHYAAYGAPEGGRDYNVVELSDRTLTDDYLPPYQAAVDAGVEMVMTSFNTLNRLPATGSKWLMRDLLRDTWGFSGMLISDWGAINELELHGVTKDGAESAYLAMKAGVDMDMCTPVYALNLQKLVEEGKIAEELIDEACMRVLTLKNKLGLFEDPYHHADQVKAEDVILSREHRELCLEAAEESCVLLKNKRDILPLAKEGLKIAFIGPYTEAHRLYGVWSMLGREEDTVSVKEGVEAIAQNNECTFSKGCRMLDPKYPLYEFHGRVEEEETDDEELLLDAMTKAKRADVCVMLLGEHPAHSGEGGSRGDIRIPKPQRKLLKEIAKVNPNIVTVLFHGRPLDIRGVDRRSKAVLAAWFPGIEGGNAVARLLFGESAPSGKLAMSFPYNVAQVPVHYDHFTTARAFNGDITNRFQSRYLDIPNDPLYPFGHGLTYTTFDYMSIEQSGDVVTCDSPVTVSVRIKNIGNRAGTEVVQLYIRDLKGSVVRPVKKLKGFERVTLEAGEEKTVTFTIDHEMLKFTTADMRFEAEPGEFYAYAGGSSRTERHVTFTFAG
ncbi:MAG: beta-glucosidase BglX [Lachnospiraceae bacterium]|nr:beta-glucosidase BglX [Lachnospiraceae bacterium]